LSERLHKLLAQHGIGSRRQVESWIREGRVLVNGQPATVGQALDAGDRVVVDGRDVTRLLAVERKLQVIAYHKPAGEMLRSRAGDDREGVEMKLPALHGGRWVAINALGFGEDGLLLLASEGRFALAVARKGHELGVEYRVRALRPDQATDWPEMPRLVDVEGQTVEFSTVEPAGASGTNMWFQLTAARTVPRGAVRALFDAAGLKVSRTLLVKWGPIALPRDLPRGRHRALEGTDLDALYALAGRDRADTGLKPRRTPRPAPDRRRKKTTARRSERR
jgi:23S rRNA pseudouridine2605 synthase